MKKLFIVVLLGLMLVVLSSYAYESISIAAESNPVRTIMRKYVSGKPNNVVVVLYHAQGNLDVAAANIKKLMKTRDPGGFMNPYWITDFVTEGRDKKSGCGIIVGQWYASGYPARGTWENIMDNSMERYADLWCLGYSMNGELTTIATQDEAMSELMNVCKLK